MLFVQLRKTRLIRKIFHTLCRRTLITDIKSLDCIIKMRAAMSFLFINKLERTWNIHAKEMIEWAYWSGTFHMVGSSTQLVFNTNVTWVKISDTKNAHNHTAYIPSVWHRWFIRISIRGSHAQVGIWAMFTSVQRPSENEQLWKSNMPVLRLLSSTYWQFEINGGLFHSACTGSKHIFVFTIWVGCAHRQRAWAVYWRQLLSWRSECL